ncbi:unnamed protein product [Paramecium pentaurelia]|uniref:RING-type domain-containing protein n=1 Tax=Paramecium pentaurelia TaxID=43138 RepID=A0A8S1YFP2_9CILI|nr:unnamed protein product [Paramecium pentaurelia]
MIRERQFEVIKTQQVNQHLLCTICREVFYNPIRATCGHTFCGTCLVRWIQMKKSCPLCRHRLERNYQFDKDILATKIVGDIEVKCLRCQSWEGTLAQFKQHKKSQCTYISTNNEIHQDAIQIGDDDEEFTFAGIVDETDLQIQQQIIENIGQQILVQIDQSQNQDQKQQPQQIKDINTNQQDPPQETNANNNNLNSDHIKNLNQNEELNNELPQQNIENLETNNLPLENIKENQINLAIIQDDLINQHNTIDDNQQRQQNDQQQQEIPQISDSNQNETAEKHQQIDNQPLILQDNQDTNNIFYYSTNVQQENQQKVTDNINNQITTDNINKQITTDIIKDDSINQNNQQNISIVEQFKTNDPDVEIIEPPIKFQNNKDLKNMKANNKFKINILRNNVKIAEPMMEELHDNLFFEFVNHMKQEMVKKLSDIQYYNTLIR